MYTRIDRAGVVGVLIESCGGSYLVKEWRTRDTTLICVKEEREDLWSMARVARQ